MDHGAVNLLPVYMPDEASLFLQVPTTVKVKGDGNCMFNAVSVVLLGRRDLHAALREPVAEELVVNYEKYVGHPTLAAAVATGKEEIELFPQILSHDVTVLWDHDKDEKRIDTWDHVATQRACIREEGKRVQQVKKYASFVSLLALAEITQRPIWSLYPDDDSWLRSLFHQRITPTVVKYDVPIFILWSAISFESGGMFRPNHFVPVVSLL